MNFQSSVSIPASLAHRQLIEFLERNGSPPSHSSKRSLAFLLDAFERGLKGRLPIQYYLASLDPGLGKTCAVTSFLKAWRAKRYEPEGSVLIGLSRLEEIERMVHAAGLPKEDFAVLTTSDHHNSLGVSSAERGSARVLFTTQQMIFSRTKGRSFADASDFHFNGKPRSLRIWDESLDPASPLVISKDDLSGLLGLRYNDRSSYVQSLDAFLKALTEAGNGQLLTVPLEFAEVPTVGSNDQQRTMQHLAFIAGKEVIVVSDGKGGKSLVGIGWELPADFAPVVILDASGRVRRTYHLWEEHREGLLRLPEATNDYRNLTVHVWQRPCGRQALRNEEVRLKIAAAVAEQINKDETSRWLIVHSKHCPEVLSQIKANVVNNGDQRIASLTWGNHHGTNDFRDVRDIVLIGQLNQRLSQYTAKALAASGLPVRDAKKLDIHWFQWGEYQHNLLQAACRGAVRRAAHGVAGKCRLFLITTPSPKVERLIEATFPGCRIERWGPARLALKGRAKEVADYLLARFADAQTESVRKGEVSDAVGIRPTYLTKIIKQQPFQAFMDSEGIWQSGQQFYRDERPDYENSAFDEIPGGYVYEEAETVPQPTRKPSRNRRVQRSIFDTFRTHRGS